MNPEYSSKWDWQIFLWGFLHGKLIGRSGLYFSLSICTKSYFSIHFSVEPFVDFNLIDSFGERVLGIDDWTYESIPF